MGFKTGVGWPLKIAPKFSWVPRKSYTQLLYMVVVLSFLKKFAYKLSGLLTLSRNLIIF
jgi:hypothetical protein